MSKQVSTVTSREVANKFDISSKVIMPVEKGKKPFKPNYSQLKSLLDESVTAVEDNKRMMELLPDLLMVKRILVPSILSPKDLSSYTLTLKFKDSEMSNTATGALLQEIEKHFTTVYNFESKLPAILDAALFDVGSYALLTLPESTLSTIVDAAKITGMESYDSLISSNKDSFKRIGILSGITPEKPLVFSNLEITDNVNHLLLDETRRNAVSKDIVGMLSSVLSMEGYDDPTAMTLSDSHGEDGSALNNPLVMKIPSDAVIPVHTPSDPSDHLGYYILLDNNGVPISRVKDVDGLGQLKKQIKKASAGNSIGGLIQSTGFSIGGDTETSKMDHRELLDKYVETVEAELTSQLRKGAYGKEVKVSRPNEVYQMMLSRALAEKKTKILYVPKELMTYFAFKFNESGIGISLLEATKIFGSLRAILLFAQVMAGVKNSVGRTKLDVTLDEDDPDPSATIDSIIHHFAGLQTDALPLGHLSAGDIVRSLQKASVDVNIDGGDAFPNTKTEITESGRDYREPNTDLGDSLRRMQYSAFGVPAELIDSAQDGELATVVVSRNQLYAKQVMEYAKAFERMGTDFIQTYIRCSGKLIDMINKVVDKMDIDLDTFIRNITFKLPMPDLARINSQQEALTIYEDIVDKAVGFYINEDTMSDLLDGKVDSAAIESLRVSYGNLLKREWMAQQNILPEISNGIESGDISKKVKSHNANVLKALKGIIVPLLKSETNISALIDKASAEPEEEVDNTDTGDTGDNPDTGDTGDTPPGNDEGDGVVEDTGGEGDIPTL